MKRLLLAAAILASAAPALAWYEPARGTEERRDLMNAIRLYAERELGAPVQFIVGELRVEGDVAHASLNAQRPGGGRIACRDTPDPGKCDWPDWYPGIHAFFTRSGGRWTVDDWSISASDVWWWQSPLCATHRAVIPEAC